MRDPYKIDLQEDLKLSLEDKKFLKNSQRVYKVLSFAELSATIAFSVFSMCIPAVACGLTTFATIVGVVGLKIEEKETDREITACKQRIEKQQEDEKNLKTLNDKFGRKL